MVSLNLSKEESKKFMEVEAFYNSFLSYVEFIFSETKNNGIINIDQVMERINKLCGFVRYKRRYLLLVQQQSGFSDSDNYLPSHAIRSTVIALILGTQLKLPNHRLIELGAATLLHDIGMLSIPMELYLSDKTLTDQEKRLLHAHPIHSYKLLQLSNFPENVTLAVLEHHERNDGSGYPRNLIGVDISLYGKIIAVACSYETLSAKRSYKQIKDQHNGILELLRNEGKRYDNTVIRALVNSLSIYPIGQYVLLSDGQKAQVIDVNLDSLQNPIVLPLTVRSEEKKAPIDTLSQEITVVRTLTSEEIDSHPQALVQLEASIA